MGVIARQSIKGAIANYLGIGIGFLTTFLVLTRCLQPDEVGFTRVLVDAAILFSSLAQLGSNATIVKFFPFFKDDRDNHGIFGWSLILPAIGFLLFSLGFLIFRQPLTQLYAERSPLMAEYIGVLPMITFFALYTTVFETNASVLLRITVPKLVREVGIRLFNLIAYLLYGAGWISFDVFVWLFCGSYGLAMLLNLLYLISLKRISFKIDTHFVNCQTLREIIRYTFFMTATALAGNIPLLSTLFLGAKAGAAVTGVYAIAVYIANVVEVPYRSLGAISQPVISVAVKEDNWAEVNRLSQQVSLHQLLVSSLIFILIWFNIDALFYVLPNGEDYRNGKIVVLVLGIAKIVNSSLSISTNVLNYSRHYSWSLLFIGILTAGALIFNNILIERWNIAGAATATLVSYLLYFGALLTFLWCRLRVNLFSPSQLKVIALTLGALLLNELCRTWIAPLFGSAILLESAVRTVVIGGLTIWLTYKWRISASVNQLASNFLSKIFHRH